MRRPFFYCACAFEMLTQKVRVHMVPFSWASDEVFLITPPIMLWSDATGLMRHPCLMATSPGRPVRALLTDERSNKKV